MSLRIYHRRRPRLDPHQKPPLGARLDPEHSLSRGLVRYWVCNEGIGGRIGDVAANDDGVRHPLYWAEGALQFPGGSYYIVGNPLDALSGPCTYLCWFSFPPSAIPSAGNSILGLISNFKHTVTDGVTGISLSVYLRSANPHEIAAFFGTGVPGAEYIRLMGTPSSIGRPITANTYGCAAMTYDGTRGRLYFDGRRIQNGAASVAHAANPWILGRWSTDYPGYVYNGLLRNIRIYNRALTDDEIAWLYAEPYAGLLPPTSRRIYSYSSRPRVHHVRRPRLDPRQKPPLGAKVDWAHPLNEGLQCCLLFNEGAGRPADIARPGLARNRYPIMWKTRDRGVSISDNIFYLDHQIKYPVREVTIVIRVFYHTPNTQNNRSMVRKYSGTANGNYRLVLHDGDYEGYVTLYANAGGVWRPITILPGGKAPRLTIGTWNDVVATYSPKTGGKIYINGRLVPISVVGPRGELYQNAIDPIEIGGGNTSCYDSDFLAIYDRELSSEEIAWLYAEPYAGIDYQPRRIFSAERYFPRRKQQLDGAPFGGEIR